MFITEALKRHLKAFVTWWRDRGEDITANAPPFIRQRVPLTRNGVWSLVKGLIAAVGLDPRYATPSFRHTYAMRLYRAGDSDLEVGPKKSGHANIKKTIYAKITKEDKLRAANELAKAVIASNGKNHRRPMPVLASNSSLELGSVQKPSRRVVETRSSAVSP